MGENNKRVEKPVANGKLKKKSEIKKLSDVFLAEDAGNVGNYILMDVIIPAIKKTVSDIVRDGIDMMLFGSKQANRSSGTNVRYVSYSKMSDRDRQRDDPRDRSSARTRYSRPSPRPARSRTTPCPRAAQRRASSDTHGNLYP